MKAFEPTNSHLFEKFILQKDEDSNYSNIGGKRKECRARGLKAGSPEFIKCTAELAAEDIKNKKTKSRSEKKAIRKERKSDFKKAVVEGKTVDTKAQKLWYNAKKVAIAPQRGAMIVLLKLNVWDLSGKLAKLQEASKTNPEALKAWNNVLGSWVGNGGDIKHFIKNVEIGKKKKPLIIHFKKKSGFDGSFSNVGGADDAVEAAAISTPVWVPIVTTLGTAAVTATVGAIAIPKKDKEDAVKDAQEKSVPPTQEEIKMAGKILKEQLDDQNKIAGMPKPLAYGLGLLLVAGLIFGGVKLFGKKVS